MKKTIFFLVTVLFALLLVGCVQSPYTSGESITKDTIISESVEETEEEPTKEIESIEEPETKEEIIKEQPTCMDECSQPTCEGLYNINCLVEDEGCKHKQDKEKIKGRCGVECLENSDCSSEETCTSNKCNKKSEILNSLEETKKVIEDYQDKTNKLNECTKLCAGDSYDLPAYRNEWYNVCYQLYYYGGMEGLDEQIADCKK